MPAVPLRDFQRDDGAAAVRGAGSIVLSGVTNRVSLVVFVLIGVMLLLFAWGILTGWASVWAEFAKDERKRAEGAEHLPWGRTRAGRGWINLNRQDHESNRGFVAVGALLTAVTFIALGIAGIVGTITFDL